MKLLIVLVLGATVIAGCDGNGKALTNPAIPVPPTPVAPTSFTTFVKGQLAATTETATPTDVSGTTFTFPDDTNDTAFNEVLPP
jgi:PBP1b-binding outer membrane lipoprotein LpoB